MASAPPHLFTLPREIRDKIYGYLHRVVKIPLGYEGKSKGKNYAAALEMQVDNFPLYEVLMTNHDLHDEYLESLAFSVTIRLLKVKAVAFPDSQMLKTSWILSRVRHATFLVTVEDDFVDVGFDPWTGSKVVTKALVTAAPKVSTIRTALRYGLWDITNDAEVSAQTGYDFTFNGRAFPPPPHIISGLPLTNHMQCILLENVMYSSGDYKFAYFPFKKVVLCVWTRGKTEKAVWDTSELLQEWPVMKQQPNWTGLLLELQAKLTQYPLGLFKCLHVYGEGLLE